MSQVIVPTDRPGFTVSRTLDKLGNRSSDTAELVLDEVRVLVSHTIGAVGRGFQQQMGRFIIERMFAAYSTVGTCDKVLARTRDFRLAELQAQVELLRNLEETWTARLYRDMRLASIGGGARRGHAPGARPARRPPGVGTTHADGARCLSGA